MIKSIIKFISKIISFCKKYAFLISVCFALFFCIYNGVLGFYKNVIWNIAIFTYYLLLLTIRMILYVREKKSKNEDEKDIRRDKQIYISTSVIMFIMNLAMILPAILLINHQKEVNLSLISAIAVAAYTTYKVSLAIIKFCKVQKRGLPAITGFFGQHIENAVFLSRYTGDKINRLIFGNNLFNFSIVTFLFRFFANGNSDSRT